MCGNSVFRVHYGFCSVQFHPEHMAGPADLVSLFDVFLDVVQDAKEGKVGKSGEVSIDKG